VLAEACSLVTHVSKFRYDGRLPVNLLHSLLSLTLHASMTEANASTNDGILSEDGDDWSVGTDQTGMFEEFIEPAQGHYFDSVNTGVTWAVGERVVWTPLQRAEDIRLLILELGTVFDAPVHLSFACYFAILASAVPRSVVRLGSYLY